MDSVIGSRTSIGRYTTIRNAEIGKFCAISWNCSIGAQSHLYNHTSISMAFVQQRLGIVSKNIDNKALTTPKTIIGNDVWIGANAVIKAGLSIGDGAIIGAGAIVTHNVEPYCIVCGIPARVIKKRFNDDMIRN